MITIKKVLTISVILGVALAVMVPQNLKAQVAGLPLVSLSPSIGASGLYVPTYDQAVEKQVVNRQLQEQTKWNLEQTLKRLLNTLKTQLLNQIVDQTTNWIQGGGRPKFVTNWKSFVKEAGDAAAGEFLKETQLGFLCDPFSLQIQLSLLPVPTFSKTAECTLSQIVGNIRDFHDDFRNGGWLAYGTSWQPQNNFFGLAIMTSRELELRRGAAVTAALNEAIAGSGFLSAKNETGQIVTPGDTIGAALNKAVGSSIDYIVNAEELEQYASAIANALINRIIKEGLATVQPTEPDVNSANSQYNAINLSQFNFSQNTLLDQIDDVLTPLKEAAAVMTATLATVNKYKDDLQKFSQDFKDTGETICVDSSRIPARSFSVDDLQNEITAKISEADSVIANLQQNIASTQTDIDKLEKAKTELSALTSANTNWLRINQISAQISSLLNPVSAQSLLASANDQQTAVNQNNTETLADLNNKLAACRR